MAYRRRRQRRRRNKARVERGLIDRSNPLETMSEESVFARYRFRPHTVLFIVSLIVGQLRRETARSCPLPPLTQVLVSLRFLATGGFCSLIADTYRSISASSVYRSIRDFCGAFVPLAHRFIKMPADTDTCKSMFYKIAGFPNVLGCVDGTFIRITAPSKDEGDYVNRKGFHSLNVQMICDAQFRVTNCVAKWPGSVHDSRIFRDSKISLAFENGTYKGLLLGDSGYPCKSYLMTPYLSPANRAQERFNRSQTKTRVLIEQTFGILKRRFSCLHSGLRMSPKRACDVIVTSVILHNIGIARQDVFNVHYDDCNDDTFTVQVADELTGTNVRNYLCQAYFT
ncbi:putative nuclease HARBI1 [Haliotis asinina]|uniref:putative nuclease HARBI1 n=1 Tax=Haliotis asinina TaxID=109174 RepID=UPI00353243C0